MLGEDMALELSPEDREGWAGRRASGREFLAEGTAGEKEWMRAGSRSHRPGGKELAFDCEFTGRQGCARVCCCFSLVRLFATLGTVDPQAPLSMGFSRQEYWSGLGLGLGPCPHPGDLPNPGTEPKSVTSTCIGRQVLYR